MSEVNLDRLRELFLADSRTVNSAKYLLIVATEAALDICNHTAARRRGRSPRDYADCLAVLGEIGAVGEVLGARLARMARFQNGNLPGDPGGPRRPREVSPQPRTAGTLHAARRTTCASGLLRSL